MDYNIWLRRSSADGVVGSACACSGDCQHHTNLVHILFALREVEHVMDPDFFTSKAGCAPASGED